MRSVLFLMSALLATAGCQQRADSSEIAGEVAIPRNELARAVAADTVLQAAERAVQAGHPWRATKLLSPLMRDAKRRTPAAVLLAARAAAGWEGWGEVDRLLSREAWIDNQFGGAPRELLARSALERNADTLAIEHAR